jgi:gamma-glutamyltranspeptidase
MLKTVTARGGMVTAPHYLASEAGAEILRSGGNAIEAMVAMAATIAVVYPHMNGIGGDGFWLIAEPGKAPMGIEACGAAVGAATPERYARNGLTTLPTRGGLAALTTAGTVAGWEQAMALANRSGGRFPLRDLLANAIGHARAGVPVAESQARLTATKLGELRGVPGFAAVYLADGRPPAPGHRMGNTALAATLERLSDAGLRDFYEGDIAAQLAKDLRAAGSLLEPADLQRVSARIVAPLSVDLEDVRLFNMPPPTQGVASLLILGVYERLKHDSRDDFALVHGLVESTKQAFLVRDANVWDPAYMTEPAEALLARERISAMAARIDPERALPWPQPAAPGDTVWMGAIDKTGLAVSFIQSLYWEFGSGVVSESTGVVWQNRGISFSLDPKHPNRLAPGRLPFHTLNPAMARFADGRTMVYGTMGGEGQPQTQAGIFARYHWAGVDLQEAVSAPRWLLGRTWGDASTNLKLESRFADALMDRLRVAGHDIERIAPFSDLVGHAGAIVRHPDGAIEGASDPRSDGRAVGV